MNLLTIQLGHNSSAFLVKDNTVVGSVSQERFNNIKNSNQFPADAINWLMTRAGLEFSALDAVGICGTMVYPTMLSKEQTSAPVYTNPPLLYKIYQQFDLLFGAQPWMQCLRSLRKKSLSKVLEEGRAGLIQFFSERGVTADKIAFLDHHDCHAFAPIGFFPKPDDGKPWLVFTADGEGDGVSSTVSIWDGKTLKRIASSPTSSSLGYAYGCATAYMGMKMLEHEYKVMGLAAYAKPDYFMKTYDTLFRDICWLDPKNPMQFKTKFPMTRMAEYLDANAKRVRFDNLAGALQHFLETLVLEWVQNAVKATGIRRVMTGGGVFMNVKLNKLIRELDCIDTAHFMPSCGDETNPLGGAYAIAHQRGEVIPALGSLYLGQDYTNDEIKKYLDSRTDTARYRFAFHEDIESKMAELLSEFQVVARFSGRAEFGARSLGNRAILANPSSMQSFFMVNDQIKSRDFWMPFAPSVLDTDADRYIKNPKGTTANYMIDAFDTTLLGQQDLRAAMHQGDKSARPQIVTQAANPGYYRLISLFKEKTGIGAVMNTSFNLHGYPLAATPEQAMFTFLGSELRYLALGNWLVEKI